VALAGEIADGAVWANAACSHMTESLRHLPERASSDPAFFVGDMIPTCIDDDRAAAAAVMRRMLTSYVKLPNYQNYWIEAGYETEMTAVRAAVARRDDDAVRAAMPSAGSATSRSTAAPRTSATASRHGERRA